MSHSWVTGWSVGCSVVDIYSVYTNSFSAALYSDSLDWPRRGQPHLDTKYVLALTNPLQWFPGGKVQACRPSRPVWCRLYSLLFNFWLVKNSLNLGHQCSFQLRRICIPLLNRGELRGDKTFSFVIFLLFLGINQDFRLKAFLLIRQKGNKRLIFWKKICLKRYETKSRVLKCQPHAQMTLF